MAHLYCYRNGRLVIGEIVPEEALPVARHDDAALLAEQMKACAIHGYENGVYFVPGVATAKTDDDAIRALLAFVKMIDEALPDLKPCTQQECI